MKEKNEVTGFIIDAEDFRLIKCVLTAHAIAIENDIDDLLCGRKYPKDFEKAKKQYEHESEELDRVVALLGKIQKIEDF